MQLFTPLEYLKISIATTFGLDKDEWNTRLEWFDENQHNLFKYVHLAEEPAKMFAGINAYFDALDGKPIGFTVPLDATASGTQILSAWSSCRSSAELCNLVDTGTRVDAYTRVYMYMLERGLAPEGLQRKDTKRAVMTAFYASEKEPLLVFGKEYIDEFYKTMSTLAPGAWALNELCKAMWNNKIDFYSWVLPDNFHASFKVKDKIKEPFYLFGEQHELEYKVQRPIDKGRALGANITHSCDGMIDRELTARCNYDPMEMIALDELLAGGKFNTHKKNQQKSDMVATLWKNYELSGFLSARILKYLDGNTIDIVDTNKILDLRNNMPKKPFQILSIFDCFNVLPTYGNDLRIQYNTIMSEITNSNMLNFILSQILQDNINIQKRDENLYLDVLKSNYAIS